MTIRKAVQRFAPMAALFAAAAAAPAFAQSTSEADRLSSQAQELYSTPKQFREAADLHGRAAQMRAADDPARLADLSAAGRLYVYSGDLEAGRAAFEQAAQTALLIGNLEAAGHLYIDAAFVAAQAAEENTARSMLRAATWIADAPMLMPGHRRDLRRRLSAEDAD